MRLWRVLLLSTAIVLTTHAQVSVPGRFSPNYAGSFSPQLHPNSPSSSSPPPVLSPRFEVDNSYLIQLEQSLKRLGQLDDGSYQFGKAMETTEFVVSGQPLQGLTLDAGRWIPLKELLALEKRGRTRDQDQNPYQKDEPQEDIMVWQLEIHSPLALSLNLIFSDFALPSGTEFFVSGQKHRLGAFTAEINNKADGVFATAPVAGDRLLLEYYTPVSILKQQGPPRIQLSHIVHGYKPTLLAADSSSTSKGYRQRDGTLLSRSFLEERRKKLNKSGLRDQSSSPSSPSLFEEEDGGEDQPRAMSGKCNVDVACHQDEYQDQSRSVGVILTDYNQKYCTGALVNNALQDGRQLFLTANHCTGFADTSMHLVMFNHEKIQCGSTGEVVNEHDTAQGLVKLGSYAPSDYTLYEITEPIPNDYGLYLSGWSASPEAPSSRPREPDQPTDPSPPPEDGGEEETEEPRLSPWSRHRRGRAHAGLKKKDPVPAPSPVPPPVDPSTRIPIAGIHHPSGDSKKISFFYNGTLPKACWSECGPDEYFHWQIPRWDQGTTEPGSSGSPLFDADKRIVGQLHGGSASCWNRNGYDVYGGIHASFQTPPKIKDRLATYLDPESTGTKVLDGYSLEAARKESRHRQHHPHRPAADATVQRVPLAPLGRPDLEKPFLMEKVKEEEEGKEDVSPLNMVSSLVQFWSQWMRGYRVELKEWTLELSESEPEPEEEAHVGKPNFIFLVDEPEEAAAGAGVDAEEERRLQYLEEQRMRMLSQMSKYAQGLITDD